MGTLYKCLPLKHCGWCISCETCGQTQTWADWSEWLITLGLLYKTENMTVGILPSSSRTIRYRIL